MPEARSCRKFKGDAIRLREILIWVTASALSVSACSGGGDDDQESVDLNLYAPQNLPPTYTVDAPDSVTAESEPIILDVRRWLGHARGSSVRREVLTDSDGDCLDDATFEYACARGYSFLQNAIDTKEWEDRFIGLQFITVDAIFDQVVKICATRTPEDGCEVASGEASMTFTEPMLNYLLEVLYPGASSDDPDYAATRAELEPMIGTTEDGPAVTYTQLDGTSGYDHQVDLDSQSMSFRFDSDQTRLEFIFYPPAVDGRLSFTIRSYDHTPKRLTSLVTAFTLEDNGMTSPTDVTESIIALMTLTEDADRTETRGLTFRYFFDGDAIRYYVKGTADDNGGYAVTTDQRSEGFGGWTQNYTEGFDGNGTMLFTGSAECDVDAGTCEPIAYQGTESGLNDGEFAESFEYFQWYNEVASDGTINAPVFALTGIPEDLATDSVIAFTQAGAGDPVASPTAVIGYAFYNFFASYDDGSYSGAWETFVSTTEAEAEAADAYIKTRTQSWSDDSWYFDFDDGLGLDMME